MTAKDQHLGSTVEAPIDVEAPIECLPPHDLSVSPIVQGTICRVISGPLVGREVLALSRVNKNGEVEIEANSTERPVVIKLNADELVPLSTPKRILVRSGVGIADLEVRILMDGVDFNNQPVDDGLLFMKDDLLYYGGGNSESPFPICCLREIKRVRHSMGDWSDPIWLFLDFDTYTIYFNVSDLAHKDAFRVIVPKAGKVLRGYVAKTFMQERALSRSSSSYDCPFLPTDFCTPKKAARYVDHLRYSLLGLSRAIDEMVAEDPYVSTREEAISLISDYYDSADWEDRLIICEEHEALDHFTYLGADEYVNDLLEFIKLFGFEVKRPKTVE